MSLPRTTFPLLLLVTLGGGAVAAAAEGDKPAALEELARGMKPGTWLEITDKVQSYDRRTIWAPENGGRSILNFGARASWDPGTRQVLFLSKGGPKDTARFLAFSADDCRIRVMDDPAWFQTDQGPAGHRVNTSAVDPQRSVFYYQSASGSVYRYDIRQGSWSTLHAAEDPPGDPDKADPDKADPDKADPRATALVYFPELEGLVGFFGDEVRIWREAQEEKGTWSLLATREEGSPMHFAEYNPVHKLVYFGRVRGAPIYKLDSRGKVTRLKDAPVPMKFGNSHVGVDAASGLVIVPYHYADGKRVLLTHDVVEDRWQEHDDDAVPEELFRRTASVSIPQHGVVLYLSLRNVYLYKHAAGE